MSDKVETIAYVGEKWGGKTPWHGKGVEVTNDLTTDQMMAKAGLDWDVQKVQSYIKWNGQEIPTEDFQLVRSTDGQILSRVSKNWHVNQNKEAFDFFKDFVLEGDMEMHTAGSLDQGRMVWALAKIKNKEFTVANKKDIVAPYLLFSNPHEYGRCIDVRFTAICVVCWNTISFALNGKEDLFIRLNHTKKFDPDLVKKTLKIANTKLEEYHTLSSFLAGKKYTPKNVVKYIKEVFPKIKHERSGEKAETFEKWKERKIKREKERGREYDEELSRPAKIALAILDEHPHAKIAKNTWWAAFNAVTFSVDHLLGTDENRLAKAWYGSGRQKKLVALNRAIEYAKAS